MAGIEKREGKRGTTYRVLWRVGGRVRSKTFVRRADAARFAREVEVAKDRGTYVEPSAGRIPFDVWARSWLDSRPDLRPSSRIRAEIAIRRELVPTFGTRAIVEVRHEDVQTFVNGLVARGAAPATVRRAFHVLSSIMKSAVVAGRLALSPCDGIRLPQIRRREMRFLTPEQLYALADEVGERDRALILTAGFLGLRWSELAGLKVSDVALLERRLTVRRGLVELNGILYEGPPKSRSGERTMAIPAFLADAIGEHIGRWPSPDGYVFTSPEGGPLRKNFLGRTFRPTVARAGFPGLRFHDLRHSAAAIMIGLGAHPKLIQQRLGHASISTTLNVYGHLIDGLDDDLAHALDASAGVASLLPRGSVAGAS